MPDENKVETTPIDESQKTSPALDGAEKQAAKTPTLDELNAELERARQALKLANNESASRRKKLDEYEAKEKKAQAAQLSEVEQLKAQLAEAQTAREQVKQEMASLHLRQAVEGEAAKMGIIDPDAAYQLADMTGVEMSGDGKITGVESALKELVKAKPYLVKVEEKKAPPNTNARDAGKSNNQPDPAARKKELAQRFRINI